MRTPAIIAMMMVSAAAQAYEAGDFVLRLGAANVDPDVSSSEVRINGEAVPGSGVDVNDNTQLGISGSYFLSNHFAVAVLAATPFQHNISLTGAALEGLNDEAGNLASTSHLPPTVTLQFYPAPSSWAFQPYVGGGFNYTTFFDSNISEGSGLAGADISLDDSFSYAAEVGVDWSLTKHMAVNAGVYYVDLDTTAEITADGLKAVVDVELDPMVYMIGMAIKF